VFSKVTIDKREQNMPATADFLQIDEKRGGKRLGAFFHKDFGITDDMIDRRAQTMSDLGYVRFA
jgi:hypothetical protein